MDAEFDQWQCMGIWICISEYNINSENDINKIPREKLPRVFQLSYGLQSAKCWQQGIHRLKTSLRQFFDFLDSGNVRNRLWEEFYICLLSK